MNLTARFVAKSLGLDSLSYSDFAFSSISIDSRQIKPHCLFIALKGENFDGHDFIPAAIASGAKGILCEATHYELIKERPKEGLFFPVENTLNAFRKLAAAWRKEFFGPIIAVGGSVGKTTTKDLIAAILSGKYLQLLKTQGSQNGFVGIPLTLMELRPFHKIAVIEIGIDEKGAMKDHLDLVSPTHGILTAVGPEHLEKLKNIKTVASEEGLLLKAVLKKGGGIALNRDDAWIKKTVPSHAALTYSLQDQKCDLFGKISQKNELLKIKGYTPKELSVPLPLKGTHNAMNLLGAIAIAKIVGLTPEEILKGLKTFVPPEGRSKIIRLKDKTTVILDYYNANPSSMKAALELLKELPGGQKWACLGDMLGLGPKELQFHKEMGAILKKLKIKNVLLYGTLFGSKMKTLKDYPHFSTHEEIAQTLLSQVKPGDVLLIKGSHDMMMEKVWKLFEHARENT